MKSNNLTLDANNIRNFPLITPLYLFINIETKV
jgi:hypothetical protein